MIGLCDIERTMKIEYPTYWRQVNWKIQTSIYLSALLRTLGNATYACYYGCEFLLCSVVENETPTGKHKDFGLLKRFDNSTTNWQFWPLKAGVLTQEEEDIAWMMHENGAVINPIALEQITNLNVLTVVQPNHQTEGMQGLILSTQNQLHLDQGQI